MKGGQFKIAMLALVGVIAGFVVGKIAVSAFSDSSADSAAETSANLPPRSSLLGTKELNAPARGAISGTLQGVLAEEAAWFDKIESVSLSELPALYAEMERISDRSLRDQVRDLLLLRWLELDPEDAYAAALAREQADLEAGRSDAGTTLRDFFRAWSRIDLEAALSAAAALTDAGQSSAAYQAIARGRAAIDNPLEYLDFVKSLPEGAASADLYAGALTRLAESDRELALKEAVGLAWGPKTGSLNALYAQWSAENPEAALEGISKIAGIGVPISDRAMAAVLPELAKIDPDLAGEKYNKLHSPSLNRGKVLYDIVNALADDDPVAAAKWLSIHGEKNYTHVIANRLNQVLLTDPALAVDMYNAVQPNEGEAFVRLQRVGDPEAILGALSSVPDSFGKDQLRAGLISQWASRDFQAAASYAEGGLIGPHLYQNPSDLYAAWEHAFTHRDTLSDSTFHGLLRTIADADPSLAIRKYQTLPFGEFRDAAGRNLTSTLARSDPFKAAEMIDILPSGSIRDSAIRTVSNRLAADDPFAASDWIAGFPEGNDRDIAAIELVNVVQDFDSRSAFTWAADIGNESRRYEALRKIVRTWSRNDPAAAAAEINAAAIPEFRKAKLLTLFETE